MVKKNASEKLRETLSQKKWKPKTLAFSGVTDPYQPLEKHFRLTRDCLEVLNDFKNPVAIITKNALIERDIDILGELAEHDAAMVMVSLTTLDASLQQKMEPRTSHPQKRLHAIKELAKNKIPVGVVLGPIVPGLTDEEIPKLLNAAQAHGARFASYIILRLPYGLKEIFQDWLSRHYSGREQKVLHKIQSLRGGRLNDTEFGTRMKGQGEAAQMISQLFNQSTKQLKMDARGPELSIQSFQRPFGQLDLF